MTADVELLPLPELPRQVEGYNSDYWEAGQIEEYAADYARACVEANLAPLQAEIERLRAEVSWLRAARIAYANEFPATEDGDPDTGNIHANIRALKARAERLVEALKEIRSRSSIDLATRSNPFELTARLGDIHQIAGAALAKENSND